MFDRATEAELRKMLGPTYKETGPWINNWDNDTEVAAGAEKRISADVTNFATTRHDWLVLSVMRIRSIGELDPTKLTLEMVSEPDWPVISTEFLFLGPNEKKNLKLSYPIPATAPKCTHYFWMELWSGYIQTTKIHCNFVSFTKVK